MPMPPAFSTFAIRLLLYSSIRMYFDSFTAADIRHASTVFAAFFSCFAVPRMALDAPVVGRRRNAAIRWNSPRARSSPNKNKSPVMALTSCILWDGSASPQSLRI